VKIVIEAETIEELRKLLTDLLGNGQDQPNCRVTPTHQELSDDYCRRPIEDLGLGIRIENCLHGYGGLPGIQIIGQLCELSSFELLGIENLGRKSLKEIKDALKIRGLSLSG